jgi:hypothetical protein
MLYVSYVAVLVFVLLVAVLGEVFARKLPQVPISAVLPSPEDGPLPGMLMLIFIAGYFGSAALIGYLAPNVIEGFISGYSRKIELDNWFIRLSQVSGAILMMRLASTAKVFVIMIAVVGAILFVVAFIFAWIFNIK